MGIRIGNTHGTAADPTDGLALVEQYLEEAYLTGETYETVLANSKYGSKKNLPKRKGQSVKFTRRNRTRLPETGTEGVDPLSGAKLSYSQIEAPIEYIKEWVDYSIEARDTAWEDIAEDIEVELGLALRRRLHFDMQGAFWLGRYKPGHRNADGETDGTATYPHFYTEAEATVTLNGHSFVFQAAPRYYGANLRATFADIDATADVATMSLFSYVKTRILNSRAPKINGNLVAVISESVKWDLMQDAKFREAVIHGHGAKELFDGHICTYDGISWVEDDDIMTLALAADGGDGVARAGEFEGKVHVCQLFGQDAFGYLRLGGKDAAKPSFSVKDLSKTGSTITIGYTVPAQQMILDPRWCASIAVPVTISGKNG